LPLLVTVRVNLPFNSFEPFNGHADLHPRALVGFPGPLPSEVEGDDDTIVAREIKCNARAAKK